MNFIDIAHAAENPATEPSTSDSPLAALGLNGTAIIFQLINFALVAAIIWFLILKPLTKKMTERQKIIEESLERAKKIEDNLRVSEQKYQERVDEAKVEANKIASAATREAEALTQTIKQKARAEIETLVAQTKQTIAAERASLTQELKARTAELVIATAEKLLKEKITSEKDKALIAANIKNLSE